MMRALTTSGSGMVAQQYNLDVIANNLANTGTTGFKQQRAEFQDMMYQTIAAPGSSTSGEQVRPVGQQVGLGTMFSATASNFRVGALQATGNTLDMAINGEGFFQVLMPDGTTAYTSDGSFKRDATGLIVTSDGLPMQPEITIPAGATALSISPTGAVSAILPGATEPSLLGTIQTAGFSNPAGLLRVGQNIYKQSGASGDAVVGTPGENGTGTLTQGYLEQSNVQVVEEMVKMISAQRAYEINSKAIQTADDMLSVVNNLKR